MTWARESALGTHLLHIKTPEGELFLVNSKTLGSRSKPVFCFLPPCLACLGLDWSFWGYRSDPLQLESNQTISFLSGPLKLCVLTIVVSSVAVFQRLGGRFNY